MCFFAQNVLFGSNEKREFDSQSPRRTRRPTRQFCQLWPESCRMFSSAARRCAFGTTGSREMYRQVEKGQGLAQRAYARLAMLHFVVPETLDTRTAELVNTAPWANTPHDHCVLSRNSSGNAASSSSFFMRPPLENAAVPQPLETAAASLPAFSAIAWPFVFSVSGLRAARFVGRHALSQSNG